MGPLSERPCVPVEVEMLPLHRPPPGTARLRRELKRRAKQERRADRVPAGAPGWLRRALRRGG